MDADATRLRWAFLPTLLGVAIFCGFLYIAKSVVVPLVLAVLFAFILNPIVNAIQRLRINRVVAVLATVLLALSLFAGVGWIVGVQVHSLASSLPEHRDQIEAKFAELRNNDGPFGKVVQMFKEIIKGDSPQSTRTTTEGAQVKKNQEVVVVRPEDSTSAERLVQTVTPFLEPLAHAVMVIILVIFMLVDREGLRNRFIGLMGHGRMTGTTRVIVDAARRLSRYLLTQLLINVGVGVLFALGLALLGVDYAILWGFLTAILRFVPYIGTWISAILPLTLSFATSPDWTQPILLLVYCAILEGIAGNLVDPLLLGHSTGVSPMALLVAAAFWTWLWGPIGLVLSTPLTVCLVVLGQHFPQLGFFSLLLGDQPALDPATRYYQRLLARDRIEAQDLAESHAKAKGREQVYDEMLLPALLYCRRDRKQGGLTADDERFVSQATREIVEFLQSEKLPKEVVPEPAAIGSNGKIAAMKVEAVIDHHALIFGCPAHDVAEEQTLQMLAGLLEKDACQVEVLSTSLLPVEIEARIAREKPALICIAVLPPRGLIQARYLCKRFHKRFPDIPIVAGYWGDLPFDSVLKRLRSAGADHVATSLHQIRTQVRAIVGQVQVEPGTESCASCAKHPTITQGSSRINHERLP